MSDQCQQLQCPPAGQVAERLNAPVSKTGIAFGLSWVRIPPCPSVGLMDSQREKVENRSTWTLGGWQNGWRRQQRMTLAWPEHLPIVFQTHIRHDI